MAAGLDCRELVELVTDYFEGALAHGERVRFEAHLGRCGGCERYLEQMRITIELVGTLRQESVPSPAREALLEAFRDWKRDNAP